MLFSNRKYLSKILKFISAFIVLVIFSAGLLFFLIYVGAFGKLPDKNVLTGIRNEEASLVYSSDSILIGKYFARNRTNVKWSQIPTHLKNALVATEDKRFFNHKGVDGQSYFRVLFKSILLGNKSKGGGSTLTQQLVKNLFGRNDYLLFGLAINKIKEIIIASRLEQVYTKEELLLLYFNSVPFGEDVYGVESAANRYFNKSVRELKIEESAVLVGMLKASSYFNPQLNPENSHLRRNLVLSLMVKEKYLPEKSLDSLQKLPLKLNYENLNLKAPAGYFVYQVKKKALELLDSIKAVTGKNYDLEKDGLKIFTTLNMHVQELSSESVKKHLKIMQGLLDKELETSRLKKQWYLEQLKNTQSSDKDTLKRGVSLFDLDGFVTKTITRPDSLWHYYKMLNASVLITNPKTGEVITWIGGNDFRTLPFDMVLSHRQIASAFKPILYATALEMGIDPCAYLENEVNKYPEYKNWEPQNASLKTTPDSTVAFWYALANSMNLPTVDLYFKVGRENLLNTCKNLKFPQFTEDAPSNALGTLDLSLYEIVRAYGSFANKGQMNDLVMINKITDAGGETLYIRGSGEPSNIFSIESTRIITAILQEVVNQGTGADLRGRFGIKTDLAGKTGTSQTYSDAWFIAYTPDLVLGTWVGARNREVHFYSNNGSGSMLAMPVVAGIIKGIENDSGLRNKYLTSFDFPREVYSFLKCEPFHQKGVRGFLDRLFKKNTRKEYNTRDSITHEKNRRGVKSFFRKIFRKNL